MVTLFTDIDNTMIYSRRRVTDITNMYLVECYNNQPLSYMTRRSYNTLNKLISGSDIQIVPVTTRTGVQFDRIMFPVFKYELLCNGGVLRINGQLDMQWLKESQLYAVNALNILVDAYKLLRDLASGSDFVKNVDELFVFGKFEDSERVYDLVCNKFDLNLVNVFRQGKKVYILPKEFDKGFAINRFKQRFGVESSISAGDEVLDFSMADYTDVFLTSNKSCEKGNSKLLTDGVFSDGIFGYIRDTFECSLY